MVQPYAHLTIDRQARWGVPLTAVAPPKSAAIQLQLAGMAAERSAAIPCQDWRAIQDVAGHWEEIVLYGRTALRCR
jgi:hypothetical protein